MFESWSRSWEFAKLSYQTLLENKHLILFPIISTLAAILVIASFALPLWQTGQIEVWMNDSQPQSESQEVLMYVTMFLFYFCNYFVITFFNTALVASVMNIMEGGPGKLSFGLSFATKRIHSIFGWAVVSAVVGMILRALEKNNKIGAIISSIIGTAWTALSFFVVPILVAEGLGPIAAIKRSGGILKNTWGTALIGNFSLGGISFLLMLPILLVGGLLLYLNQPLVAIGICVPLLILVSVIASTADYIFKAYLYSYATGRALPDEVDTAAMSQAFRQR
ncbi:DUF6159 family protein [Puniceicoccus vermicola]|uniref:Glycerophosphoryl diester phosphodiesterase membrane domain-containing protein n=1 Tax=Puniceicoccus vermicola TaxID=388746 RepID=A0A7X1AXM2_9BACT|nr:DUF6159 family protein [Puniceicoccus vermicola]MBC2601846.1 hypothetical protein [Puniceicoccus vermicola]